MSDIWGNIDVYNNIYEYEMYIATREYMTIV